MSKSAATHPWGAFRGPERRREKAAARRLLAVLAVGLAVVIPGPAAADTAFVLRSGEALLLSKNLDGPAGDGYVFVNKRNIAKEAFGGTGSPPLRWVSKHGSVTFNQFGREFPLGGINEAGLVVEALDGPAEYPGPDGRPGVTELQWVQYQLDNHRSVKEVLKSEARLRISRSLLDLHFLVADASGRTAVVELSGGRIVSYAGNDLPVSVLADDGYAESLKYLGKHQGFGGERAVPNGPAAGDRFVRAAAILDDFDGTFLSVLSDHAFTILKSVERADTQWSIVYNIPRRLILFKTKAHRRLKLVSLEALDLSCAAPSQMLSVETEAGWVLTANFEPYDPAKNRLLLETVFRKLGDLGGPAAAPAAELVRRMAAYPATCRCR
jgi:penicillin V acylase-like amidase (Ntn superfamily)